MIFNNGVQNYHYGVIDIMELMGFASIMSIAPAVHGSGSVGRVKTKHNPGVVIQHCGSRPVSRGIL
jgi:hypothetical protein